ncbi:MAG: sodium-translocating pyrophosphatase [Firmicutes bacterium]|nr:sodium-translocating pyrophosphatase [Bacillota bacterium]
MAKYLIYLGPLSALIALGFVVHFWRTVMKYDEGPREMKEIANAIRIGARAYLRRQYRTVALFFLGAFILLHLLVFVGRSGALTEGYFNIFVPWAFLSGAALSAFAGFLGMTIATYASARTTNAARSSLNTALRIAFTGGSVMGLVVVGLGLLGLSFWYFFLNWFYLQRGLEEIVRIQTITSTMLNFGMGASAMALFARVGGGIFTKAADIGADLVGKTEAGIPEDDPRNPAVIADNVGDNVGDVAGLGADLYESYVGAILATCALAVSAGFDFLGVAAPFALSGVGLLASIFGMQFVQTGEEAEQKELLGALRRGVFASAIVIGIVSFPVIIALLGWSNVGMYFSVLFGLLCGIGIGLVTEHYTSVEYRATRSVAESTKTGHATVIIQGMAVGMESLAPFTFLVVVAIIASFYSAGGMASFSRGLCGIGLAAVGMLSTLGITLATDAYGPIADNAGGIAEMSGQPSIVRERTDALDSLGNTTAATGKGFCIGSAALAALALIAAYRDQVMLIAKDIAGGYDFTVLNTNVLAGLFFGSMLAFVFSSIAMVAVGRTAQKIVEEVRRQFREIKGILEGKAEPDYARCVDICTQASLKEMVLPSVIAVLSPILVGLVFGVEGVVGLLTGCLISGVALAVFAGNAGGAWDNAKKYIEDGNLGGKGSEAHMAAVTGDTVGDPFKDTVGPSLNILIKLISMVSVVFASFIVKYHLF